MGKVSCNSTLSKVAIHLEYGTGILLGILGIKKVGGNPLWGSCVTTEEIDLHFGARLLQLECKYL